MWYLRSVSSSRTFHIHYQVFGMGGGRLHFAGSDGQISGIGESSPTFSNSLEPPPPLENTKTL